MKHTDRLLTGVTVVLGAALAWVAVGTLQHPSAGVGDQAPPFEMATEQGAVISPAEFGGKLLVLNFWASWCAGCIEEIASLDSFQRRFASQGAIVAAVSMDPNETRYRRFLQRFPVHFETVRDPSWKIAASFGTSQLPETYVIDRRRKIVEKLVAAYDFTNPDFLARIERQLRDGAE